MSSRAQKRRVESRNLKRVIDKVREYLKTEKPLGWQQRIQLLLAWGNIGYSASARYLQQVERIFRESEGPIMECGSGATTLLIAILAEKYNRKAWAFEHHAHWAHHVNDVLQALELRQVTVSHAPLKSYGEYEWYDVPAGLPNDFGMVICDGPPGTIKGGRYGLFPVMGRHLDPDCRILLDDTHRKKEQELIKRWEGERRLGTHPIGFFGSCTELALMS